MNPGALPGERRMWLDLGTQLGLLTVGQHEAITLWAAGCSYSQIALLLCVPRETARARVRRGLERIEVHIRAA